MRRFMSRCAMATRAPYRMPMMASVAMKPTMLWLAVGSSGRLKRTKP